MGSSWAPRVKNNVIRPGKPKWVSKSLWVCRIRKWVKDAQGERNGTKEPTSNEIGQEKPKVVWV